MNRSIQNKRNAVPLAVYVIGLSIFAQGTSELMLAGLLPEIARDLDVGDPAGGTADLRVRRRHCSRSCTSPVHSRTVTVSCWRPGSPAPSCTPGSGRRDGRRADARARAQSWPRHGHRRGRAHRRHHRRPARRHVRRPALRLARGVLGGRGHVGARHDRRARDRPQWSRDVGAAERRGRTAGHGQPATVARLRPPPRSS